MSRLRPGSLAAAAGLVVGLASCGSSSPAPAAACPDPTPVARPDLPKGIVLGDIATIVSVQHEPRFVGAKAVTQRSIVEVYPELARSVVDGGFKILNGDNEGFEAEIFFARGRDITGTYLMRRSDCAGQVTIQLLYSILRDEPKR